MAKRLLFIDRDGTLIKEAPPTYQIDNFNKLEFYPEVFTYMAKIASELEYELVMVTNQDGLGTPSFPEETFQTVHTHILRCFENEGVVFSKIHIDKSFPEEQLPTRKPGIGMLLEYTDGSIYDLTNSFVIGDRITDVELAKNLGCRAIWIQPDTNLGAAEIKSDLSILQKSIALQTNSWKEIYIFLKNGQRKVDHQRLTKETSIDITLNIDGSGYADIKTGIGFFDHMLDQLARHAQIDLSIHCSGDLNVDEHHTIEDTALALGEAFHTALKDKTGMERYGFALPMDDAAATVLIDFGGRNWLVWQAEFLREKIGDMPTEMFFHFFKSFSDTARCNLHVTCTGQNEHHKIESIFKAFARAIKMAIKRDPFSNYLPTTKGVL
jgi:imidazoleglycerol-phosphate dehydratase/histidinol-phosphatase